MARPQVVQDYLKLQPQTMGLAVKKSIHRSGAIDFGYILNLDGSINRTKTDEFKKFLDNKFRVIEHGNHIHASI